MNLIDRNQAASSALLSAALVILKSLDLKAQITLTGEVENKRAFATFVVSYFLSTRAFVQMPGIARMNAGMPIMATLSVAMVIFQARPQLANKLTNGYQMSVRSAAGVKHPVTLIIFTEGAQTTFLI
ncbi:MAG: hypothetical protein HPY90_04550 [Syntrophothermus sp.]|uniref:hypothetical protein n=1 Tax=Syntrophothermus sp. TaxID=2736299 RepID=UPI00257EE829|nr:hypothetical protein [Syntrophothermus sp.]NSW82537.1 hypothetical protein [Syntrophothermus sp.]